MKITLLKTVAVLAAVPLLITSCTPRGDGGDTNDTGDSPDLGDRYSISGHKLGVYEDDGDLYTYRMSVEELPGSWNSHNDDSEGAQMLLGYTTDTLYKYEYNADFTGFMIVPSMAADYPVDVTADYIGQYGINDGQSGRAYKIGLRLDLTYDNGEPITADSFVSSMKQFLSQQLMNGNVGKLTDIAGVEEYMNQGQFALTNMISDSYGADEYISPDEFTMVNGSLYYGDMQLILDLNDGGNWSVQSLSEYADGHYLDGETAAAAYGRLLEAADAYGRVFLTDELISDLQTCIAVLNGYGSVEDAYEELGGHAYVEFEEMVFLGRTYRSVGYDGLVGLFSTDDYDLVVVFDGERKNDFYLLDRLCTDFGLVYVPLYERSIDVDDDGTFFSTYATGNDTYVGFGPYKLTVFASGSRAMLERNELWHGYSDGEYIDGTYMTDRVEIILAPDGKQRLGMFLVGHLDECELLPADARVYIGGEYTSYVEDAPVWVAAMNPDMEMLTEAQKSASPTVDGREVNKTVLTIREFRLALSYATDRVGFVRTVSPTSTAAVGLFSRAIVVDPDSGIAYRDTDDGVSVLTSYLNGSDHTDGFDIDAAREMFGKAYDIALADGLISQEAVADGDWEVQITVGKPTNNEYWTRGFEFLTDSWLEAAAGTGFEGHLVFRESGALGEIAFADSLRRGDVDMLFSVGYGGEKYDPFGMLDSYVGDIAYDTFTNKNDISVEVDLGDGALTASLYDWSRALLGGTITAHTVSGGDVEVTQLTASESTHVLAACETAILQNANIIPLMTDATATLRGERIIYKTDNAVTGMGHGGIEWFEYTMDDNDFAEYIESRGGELEYR